MSFSRLLLLPQAIALPKLIERKWNEGHVLVGEGRIISCLLAVSARLHDLRSDVIAAFSGTVTFLTLGAAIIAGNYAKRQVDVLTSQHENEKGDD